LLTLKIARQYHHACALHLLTELRLTRHHLLPNPGGEISKNALIAEIAESKICGLGKARKQVLELLIREEYVEEFDKHRLGARPEKWLRRTDKKVGKMSFASRVPATELVANKLQTAPAAVCN
jgi:hypothetical protein